MIKIQVLKAVSYIVVFGDVDVQNEKDQQKHRHKLSVKKTSLIKWHGIFILNVDDFAQIQPEIEKSYRFWDLTIKPIYLYCSRY